MRTRRVGLGGASRTDSAGLGLTLGGESLRSGDARFALSVGTRDRGGRTGLGLALDSVGLGVRDRANLGVKLLLAQTDASRSALQFRQVVRH